MGSERCPDCRGTGACPYCTDSEETGCPGCPHCGGTGDLAELPPLAPTITIPVAEYEGLKRLGAALGVIFNQVGAIENHLAEEHNDPFMRALCFKVMGIIEALGVPPANKETREALQSYLDAAIKEQEG